MKKIYYIPGIFSIIFLPVLGIWYMNKYDYFIHLGSLDFVNINLEELKKREKEQNKKMKGYGIPTRDSNEFERRVYKDVHLNNDKNSKNTFKYINQFVNDVVQTKDTIDGLKIHFEEHATYKEFIEVLNIFNEREAGLYILDHNTMYFVGRDWDPNAKESEIDNLRFFTCTSGYDYEEVSDFKFFIKNFKHQFTQNKIIYSSYIIFVLLTILLILIKNKKLPK